MPALASFLVLVLSLVPLAARAAQSSVAAAAPDPATDARATPDLVVTDPETEYAARAPRSPMGDELLWLEAAGRKFPALMRTPRSGAPRGGLLVVPGPRELIERRDSVRQLRIWAAAGGYIALALQPPFAGGARAVEPPAAAGAEPDGQSTAVAAVHPDFCARLAAARAALHAALQNGAPAEPPRIAVAAVDANVDAVLACYAEEGLPSEIVALAAVGRWTGDFGTLAIPTVEFVPLCDARAVAAADRRAAQPRARAVPARRRVDLDGVGAQWDGAAEDLAKRVRGWLDRQASSAAAPPAAGS